MNRRTRRASRRQTGGAKHKEGKSGKKRVSFKNVKGSRYFNRSGSLTARGQREAERILRELEREESEEKKKKSAAGVNALAALLGSKMSLGK